MKCLKLNAIALLLLTSATLSKVSAYADENAVEKPKLAITMSSNTSAQTPLQARKFATSQNVQNSTAGRLRVPSALTIPAIIFKTLASVPAAVAAAVAHPSIYHADTKDAASTNSTNLSIRRSHRGVTLDKRAYCCFFNSCYWCSSGTGLRPPRIFTLPTVLFSVLGYIPRTVASVMPDSRANFLALVKSGDLATAFSSSSIFETAEKAVDDIVDVILHEPKQGGLKEDISFESNYKAQLNWGSGFEGLEDRLKGAWVAVTAAAVMLARGL